MSYLGYTVSKDGLKPDIRKVEAIVNAPRPSNVSTLKSFLGLVNFYGRFIPDCATLLHPLNQLLRKEESFVWTVDCTRAFEAVKQRLSSYPISAHYDVNLPVVIECDASPYGIGASLLHAYPDGSEHPVVFVSRALSRAESHYSQIEREALAIVFAVTRLHQYIYGRRFKLRTDHKPLLKIFGPSKSLSGTAASRLQRWGVILSAYDYDIEFIKGTENYLADCLSRLPLPLTAAQEDIVVKAVESCSFDPCEQMPVQADDIAKASRGDAEVTRALSYTIHGWPQTAPDSMLPYKRIKDELLVEKGCLLWGNRVIIPKKYREHLLKELHSEHLGICRMKNVARGLLWWPGLDSDIEALVAGCQQCQQNAKLPNKEAVHHWSYPNQAFERVHIDYAEYQSQYFLLLIDAYSKWIEVFELGNSATTTKTVNCLLRFIATHGIPRLIVSDNGPQFTSKEFSVFCKQNGISHKTTPPYHPASNGQVERLVQELKKSLRNRPRSVPVSVQVSRFLFSYRNTPHTITRQAPSSILFKKNPTTRLSLLQPSFARDMQDKHPINDSSSRKFCPEDTVWIFNARNDGTSKWLEGVITHRLGPLTYSVECQGRPRHVHVDYIRRRTLATGNDQSGLPDIVSLDFPDAEPKIVDVADNDKSVDKAHVDTGIGPEQHEDSTGSSPELCPAEVPASTCTAEVPVSDLSPAAQLPEADTNSRSNVAKRTNKTYSQPLRHSVRTRPPIDRLGISQ